MFKGMRSTDWKVTCASAAFHDLPSGYEWMRIRCYFVMRFNVISTIG